MIEVLKRAIADIARRLADPSHRNASEPKVWTHMSRHGTWRADVTFAWLLRDAPGATEEAALDALRERLRTDLVERCDADGAVLDSIAAAVRHMRDDSRGAESTDEVAR